MCMNRRYRDMWFTDIANAIYIYREIILSCLPMLVNGITNMGKLIWLVSVNHVDCYSIVINQIVNIGKSIYPYRYS